MGKRVEVSKAGLYGSHLAIVLWESIIQEFLSLISVAVFYYYYTTIFKS